MDGEGTLRIVKDVARQLGIVHVSVADPMAWDSDPIVSKTIEKEFRPLSIMPCARSVIVLGIPIQETILDTAPSIWYNHLYNTVNGMLDQAAERIVLELGILGHEAVYIPRDGYFGIKGLLERPESFFSHRHSAYLAGMGTFGWNSMLITPDHGPRMRFVSVITDATITPSAPMKEQQCIGCGLCVKGCPAKALTLADYPESKTDKEACTLNSEQLAKKGISPCGLCIAACPVGKSKTQMPKKSAIENIRSFEKPRSIL
jgi:epoxyqueuosine reductase QueG